MPTFAPCAALMANSTNPVSRAALAISSGRYGKLIFPKPVLMAISQMLAALKFNHGDLWLISAMLLWAIYTIVLRRRPAGLSAIGFLAAMLLLGLPALLPFYLWELLTRGGFALSVPAVAAIAYYATLPSVVAYLFWNRGVAQIGPNRAGLFVHLMPVFGALLSVIFLGERLYAYHYAGATLIFGGIWLTTRRP